MSPMQPGSFAAQMPPGEDALIRKIQELERVVREILPSVALSIKPAMDDIRANVAALAAQDIVVAGLIADLAAQDVVLTDLIAKVVVPAPFYAASSNFAVPNAWTTVLEHSLTTPAGFTQAVVTATAWARIQNTSGATASSFGTVATINGVAGPFDDDRAIPNNNFGNLQATYATLVSGLTEGQTIPIRTRVFSSPALSADADNEATINGVVLWLR